MSYFEEGIKTPLYASQGEYIAPTGEYLAPTDGVTLPVVGSVSWLKLALFGAVGYLGYKYVFKKFRKNPYRILPSKSKKSAGWREDYRHYRSEYAARDKIRKHMPQAYRPSKYDHTVGVYSGYFPRTGRREYAKTKFRESGLGYMVKNPRRRRKKR